MRISLMTDRSPGLAQSPIDPATRWLLKGAVLAATAAVLRPGVVVAQGRTPAAGTEYRRLKTPQPTDSSGKIEVIEFFWYGCPHCNALEPALAAWVRQLPADVAFRKVHVPFNEKKHQRLFFTLETLGVADALTPKVFAAIHGERNRLDTVDKMAELMAKNGVDVKAFRETFASFTVDTKMLRADALAAAWQIESVPLIGINGKYLTAPSMAGSNDATLHVADWLIDSERKVRR
jgi:thiol:disulfide interchange protein DsbA